MLILERVIDSWELSADCIIFHFPFGLRLDNNKHRITAAEPMGKKQL